MDSMTVRSSGPLSGGLRPIGDKSLTHRALIFAAISRGTCRILQPNPGEDCRATAEALSRLGAGLRPSADGWEVEGANGNLHDPDQTLDCGNSGTGIRLLTGFLAGQSLYGVLSGDASLRKRPMARIAEPLRAMGVTVLLRENRFPPISVHGGEIRPSVHRLPIASAQVKSCLLLAALGLREGSVVVEEPGPSRDHTERFLGWLGISADRQPRRVTITGPFRPYDGFSFQVPADFSASSFYMVAASIVENSDIVLESVNLNPTRTGALDILKAMGADLAVEASVSDQPEPVGTIRVRSSRLTGTVVGGELLLRAIDEVPVLAVAAMAADGETLFRDAGELRVKESDRIESTASLVRALGGEVETGRDWLRVQGRGEIQGGTVEARGDHRIAMSAIVAGSAATDPVSIDQVDAVATSDPTFFEGMTRLGADLG